MTDSPVDAKVPEQPPSILADQTSPKSLSTGQLHSSNVPAESEIKEPAASTIDEAISDFHSAVKTPEPIAQPAHQDSLAEAEADLAANNAGPEAVRLEDPAEGPIAAAGLLDTNDTSDSDTETTTRKETSDADTGSKASLTSTRPAAQVEDAVQPHEDVKDEVGMDEVDLS